MKDYTLFTPEAIHNLLTQMCKTQATWHLGPQVNPNHEFFNLVTNSIQNIIVNQFLPSINVEEQSVQNRDYQMFNYDSPSNQSSHVQRVSHPGTANNL